MHPWKKVLFVLVAWLGVLLLVEGGLQVACLVVPRVGYLLEHPARRMLLADPVLGWRPNPLYPGHDRNGFRNDRVPDRADVVALGDSQTYGDGVAADEAWPRVLGARTGSTVYSMAFGGYGPGHSLLLLDEALALKPERVVEAFYTGNDLYDAYHLVYGLGQLPGLRSREPRLLDRLEEAERVSPLGKELAEMLGLGQEDEGSALRRFLSRYSKVYGLLRTAKGAFRAPRTDPARGDWKSLEAFALAHPGFAEVFEGNGVRTILTPGYRGKALDLRDPRIAEGYRISLECMGRMRDMAAEHGATLVVLLIPTKELVFEEVVRRDGGRLSPAMDSLLASESSVRRGIMSSLQDRGIPWVDALPALRAAVAAGDSPYPESWDGHPNAEGHRLIASVLAARPAPSGRHRGPR